MNYRWVNSMRWNKNLGLVSILSVIALAGLACGGSSNEAGNAPSDEAAESEQTNSLSLGIRPSTSGPNELSSFTRVSPTTTTELSTPTILRDQFLDNPSDQAILTNPAGPSSNTPFTAAPIVTTPSPTAPATIAPTTQPRPTTTAAALTTPATPTTTTPPTTAATTREPLVLAELLGETGGETTVLCEPYRYNLECTIS